MVPSSAGPRPRHANSPFTQQVEPEVELFVTGDRVLHDTYGLGRVIGVDAGGATVDFTDRTVRVSTPFRKMTKL